MRKKGTQASAAALSAAEFDALPHSVQRKYFSTQERLRIAEQQALEFQQAHHQHGASRRSSQSNNNRALGFAHHQLGRALSRRSRLRKADSLRFEHEVAQQEAQFFLSLPPKARQLHFSPEEQVLLVGRCEQPSLPFHADFQRQHQRFDQRFEDFRFGFPNASEISFPRGRAHRRSSSASTSFGPTDVGLPLQLTSRSLCQFDTMTPPLSYQAAVPSASYRRAMSFSYAPSRHSTSSAPQVMSPPLSFAHRPTTHQRSISLSQPGRRGQQRPSGPLFDPEAAHYQDPEARKKLRMFLSAQKFDEAIEFGFPSSTEAPDETIPPPNPRYELPPIMADARNFSRDMHTFLRDETCSFLDDEDDDYRDGDRDDRDEYHTDGESEADLDSPVTPSSVNGNFRGHVRHFSPSDSSTLDSAALPVMPTKPRIINREMTLRMTLTRPDLRADDEQLYGWQREAYATNNPSPNPSPSPVPNAKEDLLALEELDLSDDMTGSKSPFAVKTNKQPTNLVTRLFKRHSKKGR